MFANDSHRSKAIIDCHMQMNTDAVLWLQANMEPLTFSQTNDLFKEKNHKSLEVAIKNLSVDIVWITTEKSNNDFYTK